MSLKTVLDSLVTALSTDAAIAAWCNAHFGRSVKVFRGMDPADPPRDADCPMIAVSTRERGRDDHGQYYLHGLVVSCGIVSAEVAINSNIVTYGGMDLINEFAALVEMAATKNLLDQSVPVTQPAEIIDQVALPWWVAHWAYQLQVRDVLA